jgi:tetratricopeptide (TPR) repeat protein
MFNESARRAIKAALNENWEEAVFWNEKILQNNPEDIDAIVRCARAHFELGSSETAKDLLQIALKLDSLHPVAIKLNNHFVTLSGSLTKRDVATLSKHQIFLEEPGRTKVVSLVNLADRITISKVRCGDPTNLLPRGHKISVTTVTNEYVGRLPDDLSARLVQLITKGNKYHSYIRTVNTTEIKVFLKERYRVPELSNIPSFPVFRALRKN